jgi:hypothetical protein
MESILSVLAVAGGLLILGWLVGPGPEQGKRAQPGQERSAERPLLANSESSEER